MKKALLFCALVAGLFVGQSAHAETYSLSFAGCFGFVIGGCFGTTATNGTNGSGDTDIMFTTAGPVTPGFPVVNQYQITGISGTVNIGGDIYTIGSLATSLGGDNKLNDGLLSGLFFDSKGIDFLLSGSGSPDDYTELNLTFDSIQGEYSYTTEHCTGFGKNRHCTSETDSGTSLGLAITDIDKASDPPAATPEPGSLALLGTSILGGAGLLRRRFRA
jgi:hypothetical protein